MRFLVDEDLPRSVDGLLHQHGHEALDVRDIGLRGASDREIAEYARKQRLCILSGDMGFADIRNYPPELYSGIVVLHLPARATSSIILSILETFLISDKILNQTTGKLAIVERGRVRIRKG